MTGEPEIPVTPEPAPGPTDAAFSVANSRQVGDQIESEPIASIKGDGSAWYRNRPIEMLTQEELVAAIEEILRTWARAAGLVAPVKQPPAPPAS